MSGEVAHQEAPKEPKATRDHQQPKADQAAVGGGALLLAGGSPMFSVGQVAGLQRLAGNASMARLLAPRPRLAPTPVVAREDKDDRAAKLSHGWMAASLKDLAALPAAELIKVEAHAKDPDVAVERFAVMLAAVRLNKAGGAKDWQIRTIYQQMQAASIPQDQQQEVATFIGAFGLFTPQAINEYVKDVGDIFANWGALGSAEERAQAFGYLINRQLGYQRVPPVKIVVATMASGGEFSKEDWTVTISNRLGALDLTPAQQSDLIRRAAANFLHEARHAEQIFTVARAQAGAGRLEAVIAKDLKIPGDIAGKAAALKISPGTPEAKAAGDWYESEFGAGKAHRDAVLGDLGKRNEEYKALPEEADAHALGTAVSDRIQGGVPAPAGAAGGDGGLPGGVQRVGQRVVQRCGPDHPDCGCEPAEAAEAATPVQRAPAAGTVVVQRRTFSSSKAKTLIQDTAAADVPGEINSDHGAWLSKASDAERFDLITACLNSEKSGSAAQAISEVWFRCANWQQLAQANTSLWQRSLIAMRADKGYFYKNLMDSFLFDTEEVARGYLNMNLAYCEQTLGDLFFDRSGNALTGPPTAAQQEARKKAVNQEVAQDLVDLQTKLADTRKVKLGVIGNRGGIPVDEKGKPRDVMFDPDHPPVADQLRADHGEPKWAEVKKAYDAGTAAIREIVSLHPTLYVLVRDKFEDSSKTSQVAGDKSADGSGALKVIAKELAETIVSIETIKPKMSKVVAQELQPIHQQLIAGTTTSPKRPNRNWGDDPVWKPVADEYVQEETKPKAWWETLGLAALEMGVYVIAGMVTGGVGFAAAMALKGAGEAAMAAGRSQILDAAAKSGTSPDTQLATSRQAEEAESEAKTAVAFAVLDAVMLGVEFRGMGVAARALKTPGEQAVRAIEKSHDVLKYERKLLGTVPPEEAATAVKEAKQLAGEARQLANEAKAAGGSRARMADKAAKRAEEAADRVEKLGDSIARAAKAAVGVGEETLTKEMREMTIPLKDGGKLIITKTGQVFRCASPCLEFTEAFADVIARNPELTQKAVAFRRAESEAVEAIKGMTNKASAAAAQKRLGALAKALEEDCLLHRRAETVLTWMRSPEAVKAYPGLKGAKLDASALARVLAKGKAAGAVKGQLLEELGGDAVESMLKTAAGRAKLAGEFAGEDLKFFPGHMLRDGKGRQLTDGIVGYWKDGVFHVVTVVEAKAGAWAAQGLKYGEAEVSALRSARHEVMREQFRAGNREAALRIRAMSPDEFRAAYGDKVKKALLAGIEDDSDWHSVALEEVQRAHVRQLTAAGKTGEAAAVRTLTTSKYAAQFPKQAEIAEELIPLPEAGQFTRSLERSGEMGAQIFDPNQLPSIVEDGKVGSSYQGSSLPQGTWKPTKLAGGRGTTRMQGFVTSDVDAKALGRELRSMKAGEGIQGQVAAVGLSTGEIDQLADEIIKRGAAPKR